MSDLADLEQRALAELHACGDEAELRAWHTRYFGDKGEVKQAMKDVGKLPPAELSAKELDTLWAELASDDGARAYRAIWTLTAGAFRIAQVASCSRTICRPALSRSGAP